MVIQRWDPVRDLVHLHERINRLFEESLARSGAAQGAESMSATAWHPPVDLFEREDRYVLQADLPGMDNYSVDLQVEGDELVLRGERLMDPTVARESYLRLERPHGSFVLRLSLPSSVNRQAIQAAHRNGVLEVVLPKKREEPERVHVSVK